VRLSGDGVLHPAFSKVERRNGGKKRIGVWMEGIGKKFLGRRLLHHFSHIHNDHSVCNVAHNREIVSNEEQGQ
jgi:hypothetical protein